MDDSDRMVEDLAEVFRTARWHAKNSLDPGAHVVDLEAFARACWGAMAPEERRLALQAWYTQSQA